MCRSAARVVRRPGAVVQGRPQSQQPAAGHGRCSFLAPGAGQPHLGGREGLAEVVGGQADPPLRQRQAEGLQHRPAHPRAGCALGGQVSSLRLPRIITSARCSRASSGPQMARRGMPAPARPNDVPGHQHRTAPGIRRARSAGRHPGRFANSAKKLAALRRHRPPTAASAPARRRWRRAPRPSPRAPRGFARGSPCRHRADGRAGDDRRLQHVDQLGSSRRRSPSVPFSARAAGRRIPGRRPEPAQRAASARARCGGTTPGAS